MFYIHKKVSAPATVPFHFEVRAPSGTPADACLYLAGDADALGAWRPDALPLVRGVDGVYRATVALPSGTRVRFKVTQGTWQTVERDAGGGDIDDRTADVETGACVAVEVAAWARPRPTRTGTIHEHRVAGRTIYVYLPPSYRRRPRARYPVLYMQDGQNLFDAATAAFGVEWRVDETAERLVREGRMEPVIVVGIRNSRDRAKEYAAPVGGRPGHADAYARFLLDAVKPFVDGRYRTRPDGASTAVGGSSLGANVSLYIAASHPEQVTMCAALSPAIWYQGDRFVRHVAKSLRPATQRVHVLVGTAEGKTPRSQWDYVRGARRLVAALRSHGVPLRYREVAGGGHNEADWAEQMEEVLLSFFGTR